MVVERRMSLPINTSNNAPRNTAAQRRLLAIVLPHWSVDCARRSARQRGQRITEQTIMLIIRSHGGIRTVCACCQRASRCGIRPGMALAHARVLSPPRRIEEEEMQKRDMALLCACAIWCQRYAPITMIESTPGPAAIIVDITGCERVHPCETRLMNRVVDELAARGVSARVAPASTAAAAVAIAQSSRQSKANSNATINLEGCSVRALRIDRDAIDSLAQVNVRTIGELSKLPRTGATIRYGSAVLRRLDEALGFAAEYLQPIRSMPPPSMERVFDGPVTNLEGIQLSVRFLLDALCEQLNERIRGGREFELVATCADAPASSVRLTLGAPSCNAKHLANMFAPMVERINMGVGVESIRISVLRMGRRGAGEAVGEWVDTLTARLGNRGVFRAGFVEDHRPAHSIRWIPVSQSGFALRIATRDAMVKAVSAWRPSHQFMRPEQVIVSAPYAARIVLRGRSVAIRHWVGPERIVSSWESSQTDNSEGCDFWRAEAEDGRWFWLRQAQSGWTLVGIWS